MAAPQISCQVAFAIVMPAEDIFEIFDVFVDELHVEIPIQVVSFSEMGSHETAGVVESLTEPFLDDVVIER